MPQDVNIRTAASIISSSLYDDRVAVVQPVQFGKIAPHVTEKLQFQPATGQFQPGTTATWRLRRLGDHILDIKLVGTAREVNSIIAGGGTFMRYPDRAPCVFVKEIRLRYNHTRLQTIRPGELQMHIEFYKDDDDKLTADYLTMSGMTDTQRNAASAVAQRWQLPMYTMWTQYDMSNAPFVDGKSSVYFTISSPRQAWPTRWKS